MYLRGMPKRLLVMLVLCAATATLVARPVMIDVDTVPVSRVVANLERMIAGNPKDVELRVNLARLHAMAYAGKVSEAQALRGTIGTESTWTQGNPYFGFREPQEQWEVKTTADAETNARAKEHLTRAIAAYREALALAPRHAVATLGLGWALKESGDSAGAITALRRAVELGWERDEPRSGLSAARSITEEAALHLRPLLNPLRDTAEIQTLDRRLAILKSKGRWVTPIAIPLRAGMSADDMVAPDRYVPFDLDGSGIVRKWEWLADDAAWLVHDHRGTGQITSALQLFGSVTFWAFWENGYHALRAMDDDGDGVIDGREREGLALWHDRNHNGISECGEVRPLTEWGIVSLSTSYEYDARHQHEIAWSPRGVVFATGEVRPTYDLVMGTRRK